MTTETKNKLHYSLIASEEVSRQVRKLCDITKYGYTIGFDKRPQRFFLLRDNNTGFQFFTDMVDLASRLEAGRMHIESVDNWPYPIDLVLDLPKKFRFVPFQIERLVISTEYGDVDSGVSLTTSDGDQITLVASSAPYGIEAFTRPHLQLPDDKFEPEYDLEEYIRFSF